MLRLFQIDYQRAGRAYAKRVCVNGIAFQRFHMELLLEFLYSGIVDESPLIHRRYIQVLSIQFFYCLFKSALHHDFLRRERGNESPDIAGAALRHLKCSRGHVQKRRTALVLGECQAGQEVMFLLFQHVFAECDSGGDHFRYAPFHQCPVAHQLRVFQLVTYRDLVAGTDEARKILFYGVMRKSCHRNGLFVAVRPLGLHQSENLAHENRIIRVCLVEVSHPVKQDCFRMLGLDSKILFEHRGIFRLFLRHIVRY